MKEVKKLSPWIFWMILKLKLIPKPNENTRTVLEKMGFVFNEEKGIEKFSFIKCPHGWSTKTMAKGCVVGILDQGKNTRIKISFIERENTLTANIDIFPRFQIIGPSGDCQKNTVSVFVIDNSEPFGNTHWVVLDKNRELTGDDKYFNEGPTSTELMEEVIGVLQEEYPNFRDPIAYWN